MKFRESSSFTYRNPEGAIDNYDYAQSNEPHLILSDSKGTDRFVLKKGRTNPLSIWDIQRTRTQIDPKTKRYSGELETKKMNEFKKQELNGVHPAEALTMEFVVRNQEKIKKGEKITIHLGRDQEGKIRHSTIYVPLLKMFFKEIPIEETKYGFVFELDLNKTRVKKLLGLI
ncbi:MAG: hypothetical protein JW703_04210 [Candidatus Diapherotrites archaeon]|nr:hypothetical protein [Candidatus Diapherotrites archaeon]